MLMRVYEKVNAPFQMRRRLREGKGLVKFTQLDMEEQDFEPGFD